MHWVIQENMFREKSVERLAETLSRLETPHTTVKVIPFGGGLVPEIEVPGPVVVVGSMSLSRHAVKMGWTPGAWMNADRFGYEAYIEAFGDHMLNHDARVLRFAEALDHDMETFFIRPDDDEKLFAGTIMDRDEFAEWQARIASADSTRTVTSNTKVIVSPLKTILSETRFIVVDGEVVTGSLYKRGGRILYDGRFSPTVETFARRQAQVWTPDRVCVLDIAETDKGMRIVEFNNFNSAGWYECDVQRVVEAINDFE